MPYIKGQWRFEFRDEHLRQLPYSSAIDSIVDGEKRIDEVKQEGDLKALVGDAFRQLGGMQRDALFYYNFLENSKRFGQPAADPIRPTMKQFGMLSADEYPPDGPPESFVGRWINYLLRTLADVTRRMFRTVVEVVLPALQRFFGSSVQGNIVTIGLSAGFPPAVVFDFDPVRIQASLKDFLLEMFDMLYEEARAEPVAVAAT